MSRGRPEAGAPGCDATPREQQGVSSSAEVRVVELWTPSSTNEVTAVACEPGGAFVRHGKVLTDLPADLQHLLQQGLLCNDALLVPEGGQWTVAGDPVDVALVLTAARAGMVAVTERLASARLDLLPYSVETGVMATLHRCREGRDYLVLRGAPEVVLPRCQTPEGWPPLEIGEALGQARAMAARGLWVVSLADKSWDTERTTLTPDDLVSDCTFTGLVGLSVPPGAEAMQVVRALLPA